MGYGKNCFLWFFFWCSKINPSDRAKRGLCCDRPLEALTISASQSTRGHAAKRNQDVTLGCG